MPLFSLTIHFLKIERFLERYFKLRAKMKIFNYKRLALSTSNVLLSVETHLIPCYKWNIIIYSFLRFVDGFVVLALLIQ